MTPRVSSMPGAEQTMRGAIPTIPEHGGFGVGYVCHFFRFIARAPHSPNPNQTKNQNKSTRSLSANSQRWRRGREKQREREREREKRRAIKGRGWIDSRGVSLRNPTSIFRALRGKGKYEPLGHIKEHLRQDRELRTRFLFCESTTLR